MTRRIIYADQLALSLEYLQDQKEQMIELANVANAILGPTTEVDGFLCTPTSPASLSVMLGNGTLFSNQNVDNTPYGTLPSQIPADTVNQILKSAYAWDNTNITFVPPGTVGFSRNDLIEVAFQEADGSSQSIPFFNGFTGTMLNPPINNTVNTQRVDSVVIQVKTGVAATTGTQVTPTPDAGFTGLWVVTTANGQTTITSGNIAIYPGAPFILEKLKDKISQATADLRYAQKVQIQANTFTYGVDTGAANTMIAAYAPVITSYNDGMSLWVKALHTNTGATTFDAGGGAKNVNVQVGVAAGAGTIVANNYYKMIYDNADGVWILTNPSGALNYAASVYLTAAQTIPNTDTPTVLNFDTVEFDNATFWNNTTKEFTAPFTGLYQINGRCVAVAPTGVIYLTTNKNAVIYKRLAEQYSNAGDVTLMGSCLAELTAGDTIQLLMSANTTANVSAGSTGVTFSSFEIKYLGST